MKQTKLKNIDNTKPGNEKDVEDLTNKISDIKDHIEEVVFGQKKVKFTQNQEQTLIQID